MGRRAGHLNLMQSFLVTNNLSVIVLIINISVFKKAKYFVHLRFYTP